MPAVSVLLVVFVSGSWADGREVGDESLEDGEDDEGSFEDEGLDEAYAEEGLESLESLSNT